MHNVFGYSFFLEISIPLEDFSRHTIFVREDRSRWLLNQKNSFKNLQIFNTHYHFYLKNYLHWEVPPLRSIIESNSIFWILSHSHIVTQHRLNKKTFLKALINIFIIEKKSFLIFDLCIFRYPEDLQQFYESGLDGIFDDKMSGKRMKLPVPETWETQISLHGNKAKIWQSLIG